MALSPELLSASSNLYCAEDADDVASWEDDGGAADDGEWALPVLSGDRPVAALLAAEPDHMPRPDYLSRLHARSLDATARQDAINWILKVNEFYRFRPVTAYLSVNYLDRFLSSNSLPATQGQNGQRSGWPMQLLSVACVSVAAKMEETHVPLLLDLQILDPRFVFEPRTVRRMELLLMAALRWRMRSVTPFDFLPHLASALLPSASASLLSRAADLILSTHRVVDFLGYRPSAIAAAAILCAADEIADFPSGDDGDRSSRFDEWVSKETVSGCRQLMEEYLIDTCPSARGAKPRREPPMPQSPVGVLDAAACGSCDTQKSSAAPLPELARAEPPPKRRRLGEGRCTESIDTGDDGKNL
ncbi:cyclin-D2-1-like isoform X2 [Phoenix dactylifera]|uniref:Cyclin-D2-1-like isoform X2 n=1 Tax=Phoenix dactylifera TaxID=42345 RepID=A0A8B7CBI9_PHODC|nr:cyclin-D2-1-like isoform X2 [Phoenix dactylifera]